MGKNFKTYATRYALIIGFVALLTSAVSADNSRRISPRFEPRPAPTLVQLQRENDLILDIIYIREKLRTQKHSSPDSASN